MTQPISRRTVLKSMAASLVSLPAVQPEPAEGGHQTPPDVIAGKKTGAAALVATLKAEGVPCVFGIPGAQENELWDEMKSQHLPYLLVTHEMSATYMADGVARSTGRPGVICVVPGPGVTNSLSGLGEALLDSVPIVAIVGDVARGEKYRPFQVHELPQAGLLQQVCKGVFEVSNACEIPNAVRQAFRLAMCGEPGPAAVVVPYTLLIDTCKYDCLPLAPCDVPFDENAFLCALHLLSQRGFKVGIYAGMGCMDYSVALTNVAEVLQAPVATSVSGKGVINECHPLAVGWGYGPQGTRAAENAFKKVDVVLAIGVRYSEVSTAFYSIPQSPHIIHVDINPKNIGRILKTEVCVNADAGVFLSRLLEHADEIRRPPNNDLIACIRQGKCADARENAKCYNRCGVDPMAFILALRKATCPDALAFVDVSCSEHWAAEAFTTFRPRTYFNPTDNQAMGWSIPASIGAQRVHYGRQVVTITGDGCFLMTAMELSTAAREGLPVKFFILDDQAYHYMQALQIKAYRRTTATILARLDYAALAKGFGLEYVEINGPDNLCGGIQAALEHPGPVLTRVVTEYGQRPVRWLDATRKRYTKELSGAQKARFLARLSSRALNHHPDND
ncbi:MAG TPA: thiamine pyrophosphate-binding protein [Gemmataceae bacterium]|nr:thiamine pyrophosphate-binding protein [Gemmataceae bacterium]